MSIVIYMFRVTLHKYEVLPMLPVKPFSLLFYTHILSYALKCIR